MEDRLDIHLIQFSSHLKPATTLKSLEKLLGSFSPGENTCVIFPEMWPSSLHSRAIRAQAHEHRLCLQWLQNYAGVHRCWMLGSMLKSQGGRYFNAAYVIDPKGRLLGHYHKIHLFKLWGENKYLSPGKQIKTFKLPWGKMGMAVCFDLRFPELFIKMNKLGAKWIVVPSAWPKDRLGHFFTLLRSRAIENQCFVVAVNKIGKTKDGVKYGGHSVVFDPWGEELGKMGVKKGILSLSLDLTRVDLVRKNYPFLKSRCLV